MTSQARLGAAHLLAASFGRMLRDWLSEDELAFVIQRNRDSDDKTVCSSHDFCDANMAMLEGFKSSIGREPVFL